MTKDAQLAALRCSIQEHARMVEQERLALHQAYLTSIQALLAALEARDRYTRGHSERVRAWAIRLARQLGLPPREVEEVGLAARLLS